MNSGVRPGTTLVMKKLTGRVDVSPLGGLEAVEDLDVLIADEKLLAPP